MELWIRSQDKKRLCKANNLFIKNLAICCSYNEENNDADYLGIYKTKERALEVLDDISKKIKNSYIVEVKPPLKEEDVPIIEDMLNIKYDGEFIMQPQQTEIKPINSNLIYYEMPKE